MVFCNWKKDRIKSSIKDGHNPYFSRWFSAIAKKEGVPYDNCHNPYFSRWFSAMMNSLNA